jgi:predicted SAM-dependent methyltransferase
MNCLMIGAGIGRREGWKTLDANPRREPDYLAMIPPLPAGVKAIVWDEIEWVHGITSLYQWDAEAVIKEIHAALAPGGKLILEQPDFSKAIARVDWIFGDPALKDPLHMNKSGWTRNSLAQLLQVAGFSKIHIMRAHYHLPERDFRIEAYT